MFMTFVKRVVVRREKMECLALILAGGKGSRLSSLTSNLAKPAVIFGGKYRIIDFTLSNCTNSGISTVGIITQYHPTILHRHVNDGKAWGFRSPTGLTILPPHQTSDDFKWYSGTAHAVYQNISYIDSFKPKHILILSGDHVYRMNYNDMLYFHKENNADLTISVVPVPMEDVSRYGIMKLNRDKNITEFQEKPENTDSNLASMGIYAMRWSVLREILQKDAQKAESKYDFGKDIIPQFLQENRRTFGFPFKGYWKDVGTVESYWEAHMDILQSSLQEELFDPMWPIFTSNQEVNNPHYLSPTAKVRNSLSVNGCFIEGNVNDSVLSANVYVGKGASIESSVVLPGAEIAEGSFVQNAIIGPNVKVEKGSRLEGDPSHVLLAADNVYNETI